MFSSLMRIARNPRRWVAWRCALIGRRKTCWMCGNSFGHFFPFMGGSASLSPFVSQLQMVGSDLANFYCPLCDCHDRERHLAMYFDRLCLWKRVKGKRILHIAPEELFSVRIQNAQPHVYIRGDLNPTGEGIQRIDVTQIPFDSDSFDMVICNHVLEHVPDDLAALKEFHRVLCDTGVAILQTPYSMLLENEFCDPAIDSNELRERFYGQCDHVRVYGNSLFKRMREVGFIVNRHSHTDVLSDISAETYGVNSKEDLILCSKEVS